MVMVRTHDDMLSCFRHSCSVRIKRIIRLVKNTRILTYFIMGINVRNNYGFRLIPESYGRTDIQTDGETE